MTPLIAAVAEGHLDAVRVLLAAGADASVSASCIGVAAPSTTLSTGATSGRDGGNGGGWDAHRIAVRSGRDDIVAALQQGQRHPTFYEPIV